jgi:integrase
MRGKPSKRNVRGQTRWVCDWEEPLTGQRRRKLFDTRADAQAFQDEINTAPKPVHTLHALVDPAVRLDEFAAQWFWDRATAPKPWRPGTECTYREHLTLRLLPFRYGTGPDDVLGRTKVRTLTAGHVEALVKSMAADGFSPATIRLTLIVFGTLLDRAVSRGLLPAHPVTKDLRRELAPYVTPTDDGPPKAFTQEQAQAFLAVSAASSRLHALYVTGFTTGLRLGELLGLQLDDHQGRTLRVARSLDPRESTLQPVIGPTKGGRERWVDVGTDLRAVLERLAAERPKQAFKHAWRPVPVWTFVTSNGTPFSAQAVRKDFRRMLRLAGLGDSGLTPHALRHSFTTWHVLRGCDPKWLQQQLGHKSIAITLDVYAKHATLSDHQAADALGSALLGNQAGNGRDS